MISPSITYKLLPRITRAAVRRLMLQAGAHRVSQDAENELLNLLEGIGLQVSREAWDYARYAKRKTMKAEDIQRAARKFHETTNLLNPND